MASAILSLALSDEEDDYISSPPRRVLSHQDLFLKYEEEEFRKRFRLSKSAVLFVLDQIEELLEFPTNRNCAVSPINHLQIALRYYATGCYSISLGDYAGVSTANRIVHKVSKALCTLRRKYIRLPQSDEEIKEAMLQNYSVARFPKVVGMLDCTHIRIRSPGGNQAELFRNRKGYFSLNVQTIANENLEIVDLVARWPGSAHDSTIFNACHQKAMFEDGRYGDAALLGDSGYPCTAFIMTPLTNPVTRAEHLFNESHIRTRNCVERLYGVWKRRFPVLALGFNLDIKNIFPVITATAILHNVLRQLQDPEPIDDPTLPLPLPWDALLQLGQIAPPVTGTFLNEGQRRRNTFIREYFQRLL